MPDANVPLYAFNRGIISRLGLARTDIERLRLAAETQTNWMPRVLGSMMLRPGLAYIGATKLDVSSNSQKSVLIPFVADASDANAKALVEITPAPPGSSGAIRVWTNDAVITRTAVSTTIINGLFDANLNSWTNADESGATSSWMDGAALGLTTGGYMSLVGTRYAAAIRKQQVTIGGADQGKRHAFTIVIARGVVTLRVGSSDGGDEYIAETDLLPGTHSLAFTHSLAAGNFVWIQFSAKAQAASLVDSIAVEGAGAMTIAAPWAAADLPLIRWDQSVDVLFVACKGYQQRRIERRGNDSWSLTRYQTEDGPFRVENTSTIRLTPGALVGDTTLQASANFFRPTHVGALFRISSIGQKVSVTLTAQSQWSDPIKVIGVGSGRQFSIDITGTWVATVKLQRSVGDIGAWTDVSGQSWTTNVSTTYSDALDNQTIYYRIGIDTGGYTSGTATASLTYGAGSISGVVRVSKYTDQKNVNVAVVKALGGTAASEVWREGLWSDNRGWPSAVALYEGRLFWFGKDKIVGSVSDAFASFDPDTEGDSGPISRSIGAGPVDTINWALPLLRLAVGGQGAEKVARSTTLDEILSPTNFNLKDISTQGSAAVGAVKIDNRGIFVQASGTRVFDVSLDPATVEYQSADRTLLVPEIGEPSIIRLAVQRKPDTRVHCVRSDGSVAVLVSDPAENVTAWMLVTTDGAVEDAVVLPGATEDQVYYVVKRTISGVDKRYLERWAMESECRGGTITKLADSFVTFTNNPANATVTGLWHLEGKSVVVWADGKCLADASGNIATFTVSASTIALTNGGVAYSATTGVVGLSYTAQFKSAKLAYAAQGGTALVQRKRIDHLGLILADAHFQGLKYGPDFANLDDLPLIEAGTELAADTVHAAYDADAFEFPGEWDTDARLCLQAQAPRPVTVLAAVVGMETHEKA